ncbi:MAG: class I SAM-dependent methyltransferase [Acidobacteria bacterium]|nr:class I SAM-dependent methyltransferase [Acidobacteriota bacterium]
MDDEMRAAWDARYADQDDVWGSDANRFLVEIAADLPAGRALDLGSGQGRNAFWLAGRGHVVTGLELSPVAVDQATAVAEEHGLDATFEAVDLTTWNPDGEEWDLVVLAYLQLPAETRRPIHAVAATAVAPGGRLIVIAHHRDNLDHGIGGPPYPEVLFTEDELAEDFAALDIERNERVLRPTDDGDAIDVVLVASRPSS